MKPLFFLLIVIICLFWLKKKKIQPNGKIIKMPRYQYNHDYNN